MLYECFCCIWLGAGAELTFFVMFCVNIFIVLYNFADSCLFSTYEHTSAISSVSVHTATLGEIVTDHCGWKLWYVCTSGSKYSFQEFYCKELVSKRSRYIEFVSRLLMFWCFLIIWIHISIFIFVDESQKVLDSDKAMVRENVLGFIVQVPPLLR
jgi:hypothetical protein